VEARAGVIGQSAISRWLEVVPQERDLMDRVPGPAREHEGVTWAAWLRSWASSSHSIRRQLDAAHLSLFVGPNSARPLCHAFSTLLAA
jgi:hypothetical protein